MKIKGREFEEISFKEYPYGDAECFMFNINGKSYFFAPKIRIKKCSKCGVRK